MAKSRDETRRAFLLKVARTAVFVPPMMASVGVRPLAGQGSNVSNTGGTKGAGVAAGQTTVGSLSPTANAVSTPTFQLQQQDAQAPWSPETPGAAPPWSRPPPTQTGR